MTKSAFLVVAFLLTGCSKPRHATYDMSWRIEPDHTCPTMRHVVLDFANYPTFRYGICSNQLAAYLESLGTPHVPVQFDIDEPSAQLGGGHPTQLGDLKQWKSEFDHMGQVQDSLSAQPLRHPWEQFRH